MANTAKKKTAPGKPTAAAPKAAKTAKTTTTAAPKKKAAPRAKAPASNGSGHTKAAAPAAVAASREIEAAISVRAYYIAERRQRLGLPGDASSDWLEAEVQVYAELSPSSDSKA